MCLKSENKEIKLGVLKSKSGSAQNIFNELEQLLNEFAAWSNIKMIISDTTSVNTGRLNGIVVKLQKKMSKMGLKSHSLLGASIMFYTEWLSMFWIFISAPKQPNQVWITNLRKKLQNITQNYKIRIQQKFSWSLQTIQDGEMTSDFFTNCTQHSDTTRYEPKLQYVSVILRWKSTVSSIYYFSGA